MTKPEKLRTLDLHHSWQPLTQMEASRRFRFADRRRRSRGHDAEPPPNRHLQTTLKRLDPGTGMTRIEEPRVLALRHSWQLDPQMAERSGVEDRAMVPLIVGDNREVMALSCRRIGIFAAHSSQIEMLG